MYYFLEGIILSHFCLFIRKIVAVMVQAQFAATKPDRTLKCLANISLFGVILVWSQLLSKVLGQRVNEGQSN